MGEKKGTKGVINEDYGSPVLSFEMESLTLAAYSKGAASKYGLTEKSLGQRCCSILVGRSSFCDDCPLTRPQDDLATEAYSEQRDDLLPCGALVRCSTVEKDNKRYVLLDTTGQDGQGVYGATALADEVSSMLANATDFEQTLEKVLVKMNEAYGCSSSFISWKRGDSFPVLASTFPKDGREKKTEEEFFRLFTIDDVFKRAIKVSFPIFIKSVKNVTGLSEQWDGIIKKENIESILFCPLHQGKERSGFLVFLTSNRDKVNALYPSVTLISYSLVNFIVGREMVLALSKDPVTGLLTDQQFDYELHLYFVHHPNADLTMAEVVLLDYRNLKSYYSAFTFRSILGKIGKALSEEIPSLLLAGYDSAGRFLLLLSGDEGLIYKNLDDLRLKIMAREPDVDLRFSFAICHRSYIGEPVESLERKLELAIESSKGKEGIVTYDPLLLEKDKAEEELVKSFPYALSHDEFKLYVQGKYDTSGHFFYGAEALVRWQRKGEMLYPDEFISLFEKNGLIVKLDRFVLTKVLEKLKEWREEGRRLLPVSVNVSSADFSDPKLFETYLNLIDFYEVSHSLIEFEITEGAYYSNEEAIRDFLAKCRKAGINVFLDDFGSRYSSFFSLKDLDIDGIRINYRALAKTSNLKKVKSIIESVVWLAKTMNLRLVVRGVETAEEGRFFSELGADHIQGFLYARPVPVDEFSFMGTTPITKGSVPSDSPLYDEICQAGSPAWMLFHDALSLMGIYLYNEKGFFLLSGNKGMSLSVSFGGNDNNRLNTIDERDRGGFERYLQRICNGDIDDPYFEYRHSTNIGIAKLRCQARLLKKTYKGFLLLFEATPLSLVNEEGNDVVSSQDMTALFDNSSTAVAVISDVDKRLIYLNDSFRSFFPEAMVGESCHQLHFPTHDCSLCPLFHEKKGVTSSIPSSSGEMCRLSSRSIAMDFGLARLVKISPQYDKNLDKTSLTISEGILSLTDDCFTINFETDEWERTGRGPDGLLHNSHGNDAENALTNQIERAFAGQTKAKVLREISFPVLKKLSKTASRLSKRYYIESLGHFYQFDISFLPSPSRAVMFISMCDEDALKDYDGLTRLFSRNAGINHINDFIQTKFYSNPTLVLFDLNSFKNFNDKYGHPAGDKVLSGVGEALLKEDNLHAVAITRLGGDEFVFLTSLSDPLAISLTINAAFRPLASQIGIKETISATIGTAISPVDGSTFAELYHVADERLYEEKKKRKASL